jgi:hypothetical protein
MPRVVFDCARGVFADQGYHRAMQEHGAKVVRPGQGRAGRLGGMGVRIEVAMLALFVAGCAASPGSPTVVPSSLSASPSAAEPSATASSGPTGAAGMFSPDLIAAVVTTDLVVRSAPGTGADSKIYPGTLNAPRSVFVVDGPAFADGYEWYLVDPLRSQGIDEVPQPGWIAAAGKDGEAWLGPDPFQCPATAQAELIHLEPQRGVACYGDSTLTVVGTLAGCQPSVIYGSQQWVTQCRVVRLGFDVHATPDPNCFDCYEPGLWIVFNGDIGLAGIPDGAAITVRGHFDDASAQTCDENDGLHDILKLRIHACRMQFVATHAAR